MAVLFGLGPFPGRTPGIGEMEITGAELGQRFFVPDAATKKRLKGYDHATKMLDPEQHVKEYQKRKSSSMTPDTEGHWIPLDLPGMQSRLVRHYGLGDTFEVRAQLRGATASGDELVAQQSEAQAEVDRITKNSEVECLLRQTLEVLPALGDAVVRVDVRMAEDSTTERDVPQAFMRYVAPHHYIPTLSPVDQTQVEAVTLAWVFPMPEAMGGAEEQNLMVLREQHVPGSVKYALNRWDGSELGDELVVDTHFPGLVDFETGIDEIPVVHLGWQTRAGHHFGVSELNRVAPIVLALENRLAQLDEVLEKHARPKLIVGPGVLDENGRARLKDFDVIEVSPDIFEKAVKPEYLTWDMQQTSVAHEIEKLEEYYFMTTETSPASFGLERDGSQVESARALRFKAHRTVNKVEDARKELAKDIRALYRIAQKLELAARRRSESGEGYRRSDVAPVFGDPILEDQTQEVQDYVARKGVGLVSRVRAIMDLENLRREDAEQVVREVLQDEVDEAAAATATLGGPDDLGGAAAPPAGEPLPGAEPVEPPPANLQTQAGVGVAEDVQKTVLNGAQVQAMQSLVVAVGEGSVPRDSAAGILRVAFGLTEGDANAVLGSVEEGSVKPPAPVPFGGGVPLADDEDSDEVNENEGE